MYIINCIVLYFLSIHDHNTIRICVHKDVGVVKFWSIKYMYIQINMSHNTNIGKNVKECLIQPTGILLMH